MVNAPKSNCYGFVYAGINNSEEDFYCDVDLLKLRPLIKQKVQIQDQVELTSNEIFDLLNDYSDAGKWKVLELFDHEKRSQHAAFLDEEGNFYDQAWPDKEIRLKRHLDDLLAEYVDLFGTAYYQVHILKTQQLMNVENFMQENFEF